ncbi:MAG: 4-hydroxythreonine-4-phosphate dehydrogenase PdxA [Proteobacteria bacterium]|nr:4-hydroxythreonine-4-phosphate dehydrogenase PdxA [Pseudomonadota bacterium]
MSAPLALTTGEPAGIGPDLAIMWAQDARDVAVVALADPALLVERARQLGLTLKTVSYPGVVTCAAGELSVESIRVARDVVAGRLDIANVPYVFDTLATATDGCLESIVNDAGVSLSGHTEFRAERCSCATVVMLLVAGSLRVALATTHVPLADVPGLITRERLTRVLNVLLNDLTLRFGIAQPRVLVAGLNPHAGEGGHLGREEIEVIAPVCEAFAARGVVGPLPADTLFTQRLLAGADAVLAMYHDQGLPVLKHVGFGSAVNVTLGLPIVRTSVDHGTALDLAGRGGVDAGSFIAAVELAAKLAAKRTRS